MGKFVIHAKHVMKTQCIKFVRLIQAETLQRAVAGRDSTEMEAIAASAEIAIPTHRRLVASILATRI